MPTLFRLVSCIAVLAAVTYGAMVAIVTLVRPQQRQIVQAIVLPADGNPSGRTVDTGRSVALTLSNQASALVHHSRRRHQE